MAGNLWACQKHWAALIALTPHMNGPFFDHDGSDSVLPHPYHDY